MIQLGVSVYPEQETLDEINDYLKLASSYGFKKVFTSMFTVEGDRETIINYFKSFATIAHSYGMVVSGDVNTEFLKKMNATYDDLSIFKEIGIDILRLDSCYFDERDVTMINNPLGIGIEITAAFEKAAIKALENGAAPNKFSVCHNFYPQKYTGADIETIREVNNRFKSKGLRTIMFMSSNVKNAHGPKAVYDGLPTIEDHRFMSVEAQLKHIISFHNTDEVIFGNAFASEEEFKTVKAVIDACYPNIKKLDMLGNVANYLPHGNVERVAFKVELDDNITELEKQILLDFNYHNAGEYIYYMIRSRWPRIFTKKLSIPHRKSDKSYFEVGDVVMCNDNCSPYLGEVEIVLKRMENDGQRNLLGHISNDEHIIFNEIKTGEAIGFKL